MDTDVLYALIQVARFKADTTPTGEGEGAVLELKSNGVFFAFTFLGL